MQPLRFLYFYFYTILLYFFGEKLLNIVPKCTSMFAGVLDASLVYVRSSITYVRKNFSKNYVRVRIRELEMLVFRKILRTYLMDGPLWGLWIIFLSQIILMHGIGLFQLHTPWMHQKSSGFLMLSVVRFSDVFRGYGKRAMIWNMLTKTLTYSFPMHLLSTPWKQPNP